MNYCNSASSLIKQPSGSIITKTPLNRQYRQNDNPNDQSVMSQFQSPTLRQAMSPKAARDYLNSLKTFINQYETKPASNVSTRPTTQSTHQMPVQTFLYFPLQQRLNDEIKLMTPHRIEVKKYNQDGTVHSLRYYYITQASIGSSNDVPAAQQILILGGKQSGKKKLFYELIRRHMPKNFKLKMQSEQGEKVLNLQVSDDLKSIVKTLLSGIKLYQLLAQGDQVMIGCRSPEGFKKDSKDRGILLFCIKPGKQSQAECVKTLKFVEEVQKS